MENSTGRNYKRDASRSCSVDYYEATASSLEETIQSNRRLQASILSELERIGRRKASNRAEMARLQQHRMLRRTTHVRQQTFESLNKHNRTSISPTVPRVGKCFFSAKPGKPRSPEPNSDTVRRWQIDQETFFYHTQPPWSQKESKALQDIITQLEQQHNVDSLDYQLIAQKLQKKAIKCKKGTAALPRTSCECQIHHQALLRQESGMILPFSEQELLAISERVHQQSSSSSSSSQPNWESIEKSVSEKSGSNRTAWECLVAHQTRLRLAQQQQPKTWTPRQDQLLLKYVAAAGPAFVVDGNAARNFAERFDPSATIFQLQSRINNSLVNPNLKRDGWTDDEERRLVIYMKMFRDSNAKALHVASTHFPNRSARAVTDKWKRSLDPEYSSRPFTAKEDKELLEVMQRHGNKISWTELSERYFSGRHPQRLAKRWVDLASDQDILTGERDRSRRRRSSHSNDEQENKKMRVQL